MRARVGLYLNMGVLGDDKQVDTHAVGILLEWF